MRYFIRIPNIACAETEAAAKRLEARGLKECPREYYMVWWRLHDEARQAELAREDERANERAAQPRIVGALPGVVKKVNEG